MADHLAHRPAFAQRLLFVKAALQRVVDLQELDDVRPGQLVRQRRTFRRQVGIGQVELAKADQVAAAESLAVTQAEVGGQGVDKRLAILGAYLAGLLELDDMAAHLPVGLDELGVNGLHRPHPALGIGVGDLLQELAVAVAAIQRGAQLHATPIFFRCLSTRWARVSISSVSRGMGVA